MEESKPEAQIEEPKKQETTEELKQEAKVEAPK